MSLVPSSDQPQYVRRGWWSGNRPTDREGLAHEASMALARVEAREVVEGARIDSLSRLHEKEDDAKVRATGTSQLAAVLIAKSTRFSERIEPFAEETIFELAEIGMGGLKSGLRRMSAAVEECAGRPAQDGRRHGRL